jgi:hypothetical protein
MLKREALSSLAADLAGAGVPQDLLNWLIKLKLLVGMPFQYLVPHNDFLPPETIRFFHVDPEWINAVADGALSIGRHYNGPDAQPVTLHAETAHTLRAQRDPDMGLANLRRRQLSLAEEPPRAAAAASPRTGFLLNSAAVKSWKSIDVAGYAKGSSPYDYEQNRIGADQVASLKILRLVRLSPSVLLGIFEDELYELVLHQPPEAIHFGFQQVDTAGNDVTKNLRVPTTNWDDPDTSYDADTYQNKKVGSVFANAEERVLDMLQLSRALAAQLAATGANGAPGYYQATPANANYKDHLVASDFGLEMVQGVGLVSFINE